MITGLAWSSIGLTYLAFVDDWLKLGIVAIFFSFGNRHCAPDADKSDHEIAPPQADAARSWARPPRSTVSGV
ncbi:MAG: hypothetical protein IPM55_14205 [Acidobacteria bacterium]|nr:hypothetical protein [Acidobacteriota bacterium]